MNPRGLVLWKGKSLFDNNKIIVVATTRSDNRKTGPMIQTWILREDEHPVEALRNGDDLSICGDCKFRPDEDGANRTCYVGTFAPSGVWRAYRDGNYTYSKRDINEFYESLRAKPRAIRLGAYGDPAAVPVEVWRDLLANVTKWTGYTHAWKRCDQELRKYCMASVDSVDEFFLAKRMGWRTFRTRLAREQLFMGEIACPAAEEMGKRSTCEKCTLCDGRFGRDDHRRDIAIIVHSNSGRYFESARARAGHKRLLVLG